MARPQLPPDEAQFYETINMPRQSQDQSSIIRRNPANLHQQTFFGKLANKVRCESIGLVDFLVTCFVCIIAIGLGLNSIGFTFFGKGLRAPLQPAETVPFDSITPVKTIPRIN